MNAKIANKDLFFSFFRLGITAFGGPAMIVHIRAMAVEQKRWLTDLSFRHGVAFCQMVPGATAMQMAAYVGLRVRGIWGAAAAFIGFGLPAFLMMTVLSALYIKTGDLPVVVSLFEGLQAIVVAIVANAVFTFGRTWLKGWRAFFIAMVAAILFSFNVGPVYVIILAALCGLGLHDRPLAATAGIDVMEESYSWKPLLWICVTAAAVLVSLFLFQRQYFDLARLMSKIDLFAFGGGFSSLPLMFNEIVHVRGWLDSRTFLNGIALGQITPGPIVITATFIGYLKYGLPGGILATIFIFLPSFLIVAGVVPHYDRLRASVYVRRAIQGILYSFVGLLVSVTGRLALDIPWDAMRFILAGGAFVALRFNVGLPWVVIVGAVISILLL